MLVVLTMCTRSVSLRSAKKNWRQFVFKGITFHLIMGRLQLGGCVFAIHDISDQVLFSSFFLDKISFEVSEKLWTGYSYTAKPKLLNIMGRTIKAADSFTKKERGGIDEAAPVSSMVQVFLYAASLWRTQRTMVMQPADLLFTWAVQSLCIMLYDRLL